MDNTDFEDFPIEKEEFAAQVRLALVNVLAEFGNQPNLLRPKINSCLEENFGIRSRDVNLRIPEGSKGFSVQFAHPVHGDMTLEA